MTFKKIISTGSDYKEKYFRKKGHNIVPISGVIVNLYS